MADLVMDQARYHVGLGFNWTTADVRGLLVAKSTWTPAVGNTYVQTILTAGAVEAASTASRQALTGKTVTLDSVNHWALWDADNVSYPGVANLTAFDTFVLFNKVTNDTDSWLMGIFDLSAQTGNGSNIAIAVNSLGCFKW